MDYQKHYNLLINRARTRVLTTYTERHHIIPDCFYMDSSRRNTKNSGFIGHLEGDSNDPSNIVCLTPEEHYLAHQLLVKIYPDNLALTFAAKMMANTRPGNKMYGWLRRAHAEAMKNLPESTRLKFSELHKGKIVSEETRLKMSMTKKKRNAIRRKLIADGIIPKPTPRIFSHSEETKQKISIASKLKFPNGPFCGRTHSEESKRKIGESCSGYNHTEETKQLLSEMRTGENNPMFGTVGTMTGRTGESHPTFGMKWYINIDTKEVKKFRPEDINTLTNVWKPGRKI